MQMTKKNYGCMKRFWDIMFFGGIIGTASFLIAMIAVWFYPKPMESIPTIFVGLIFYGVIPGGLGWYFRKKFAKAEADYKNMLIQRAIYTLAKENKGVVKISDLAFALNIPYEEAKELLSGPSIAGMAQAEIDDDGYVYFVFPEFKD